MRKTSCVCLAAGSSSRMIGGHKLLKDWEGFSIVEHTVRQIVPLDFLEIIVVLGSHAGQIIGKLREYPVKFVVNENFQDGMHSSLRAAVQSLNPAAEAMVVCLADQPFHLSERLSTLMRSTPIDSHQLLRSDVDGKPGHPVLIGRSYWPRILSHPDGDYGCAYLFRENPYVSVPQHQSALWDLDTQEDFMKYKSLQENTL